MGNNKNETISNLSFETHAYKYIMLFGFISDTNSTMNNSNQTLVGDRGAINIIIEYLDFYYDKKLFLTWCCWSLVVI